jgi:hypothetical protein
MFTDPYIKCGQDEIKMILTRLDHDCPEHGFQATGLMGLKKQMGCYKDALYYDLTQVDMNPSHTMQCLMGPHHFFLCDGSREHLAAWNKNYPLTLDRTNILEYIRFYFRHITGPHGLSILIDTVEDLHLKEEPTPALRRTLHDKIIPLTLNASLSGGGYQARGTVMIEQTLFSIFIDVKMNGEVTVELGRVLADLLPVSNQTLEG